jgi:8-oxo-dGTP diphosphatase
VKWAYAIAFKDDRFLMVWNPKRNGWEMPGGHVEKGESFGKAVTREFREECGQEFIPLASMHVQDGAVFAGLFKENELYGEMAWDLFEELPQHLSFPEAEYHSEIIWARAEITRILKYSTDGGKQS